MTWKSSRLWYLWLLTNKMMIKISLSSVSGDNLLLKTEVFYLFLKKANGRAQYLDWLGFAVNFIQVSLFGPLYGDIFPWLRHSYYDCFRIFSVVWISGELYFLIFFTLDWKFNCRAYWTCLSTFLCSDFCGKRVFFLKKNQTTQRR